MNLAVPVGRLTEFLACAGRTVLQPTARSLPGSRQTCEMVGQAGTGDDRREAPRRRDGVHHGRRRPARLAIWRGGRRVPGGTYEVEVTPVPTDPPMRFPFIEALVEAFAGEDLLATVHRTIDLVGAPMPPVAANQGVEPGFFIIQTLPRPPAFTERNDPRRRRIEVGDRRYPGPGSFPYRSKVPRRSLPGGSSPHNGRTIEVLTLKGRLNVTGEPRGRGSRSAASRAHGGGDHPSRACCTGGGHRSDLGPDETKNSGPGFDGSTARSRPSVGGGGRYPSKLTGPVQPSSRRQCGRRHQDDPARLGGRVDRRRG